LKALDSYKLLSRSIPHGFQRKVEIRSESVNARSHLSCGLRRAALAFAEKAAEAAEAAKADWHLLRKYSWRPWRLGGPLLNLGLTA
jgi:hypothetical protein